MSQFGKTLPAGRYVLNEGIIVNIAHSKTGVIMCLLSSQNVDITNTAQNGSGWNIWYTLNQKEQIAHIIKAPRS
jgi:hypothetical protein